MAEITINEISQNYTYNIGTNSYAQVALPITSCWGPGYFDPEAYGVDKSVMLEETVWQNFPATQEGLEAFVSTYRGAASNYRTFKDYSYHMAMTLLTAGYDVLVCRICPGTNAQTTFELSKTASLVVKAKYPGTFGNSLRISLSKIKSPSLGHDYWNVITYVVDSSGVKTAVENKVFVMDIDNSSDSILHIEELESNFLTFKVVGAVDDSMVFSYDGVAQDMSGGADISPIVSSEAYDAAYEAVKQLSEDLAEATAKAAKAKALKEDDESKIASLESDINAYAAKISAAEAEEPRDETKINKLKADKAAAEAKKAEVEKLLNGVDGSSGHKKAYEDAQAEVESLSQQLDGDSGAKATLASESVKFRRNMIENAAGSAKTRYGVNAESEELPAYVSAIVNLSESADALDNSFCLKLVNQEWIYTQSMDVYDLLKDRLAYHPNRVISPGWDDQNITDISGEAVTRLSQVSPLHAKLMDIGYNSRCATAMIDIPKCLPRAAVYNTSTNDDEIGYAQLLARHLPDNTMEANGSLYATHSALFAPWGQYRYVGTNKQSSASPSFQVLLIQRAMILNQSNQYEWALPENRKHNIPLGKPAYKVPQKLLNEWQSLEGVGVNVIAEIPDMGMSLWGNSTLYEVPPATYQALANLSTRYLVNAVKDVIYRCGITITWKYNNNDAYSAFYAGVTPTLDLMKNVGAIEGYAVKMSADINGLDQVNANSVIGKVYLIVNGVVNNISVDLIALPPGADLSNM